MIVYDAKQFFAKPLCFFTTLFIQDQIENKYKILYEQAWYRNIIEIILIQSLILNVLVIMHLLEYNVIG